MQKQQYKELEPMAFFFAWVDKHKRLIDTILWVEVAVIVWVVLNYHFTTNF